MLDTVSSSVEGSLFPTFASLQQEAQYVDSFALRFSLQYLSANDDIRSLLRSVLYEHIVRFCDRAMLFFAPFFTCFHLAHGQKNAQSELEGIRTICQKYSLILQALDAGSKENPDFLTKKQILDFVERAYQEVLLCGYTQEQSLYK